MGTGASTTGSGSSSSSMGTGASQSGATGLNRADEAAGKNGQRGRDNAREHQRGKKDRD
jgi:hypothetical protein